MAPELLTFDPDGDLLLHLPYPEENDKQTVTSDDTGITGVVAIDASADVVEGVMTPEDVVDEPKREIHMLVSSKHLMLASPVFRAMLQHRNFKEGDILSTEGKVEVPLPDDDHVAFTIMLDIIHGRVKKIPRQVSLEVMTNLSILVDKYETLEVFGLILHIWMPALEKTLPTIFTPEVLPWLSIAYVFELEGPFKKLTRILERESDGTCIEQSHDLPISARVLDEIENQRQKAIKDIFNLLHRFFCDYSSPGGVCDTLAVLRFFDARMACDGMMLGTFLRSATVEQIWPTPPPPYKGITAYQAAGKVKTLNIKSVCDNGLTNFHHVSDTQSHFVKERWHIEINDILTHLQGLELDAFVPKS